MELGYQIPVLDHGYVKLIETMGTEETIVEAARMSTGKGFLGWDTYKTCKFCNAPTTLLDAPYCYNTLRAIDGFDGPPRQCRFSEFNAPTDDQRLLTYMYSNGHTSPFEMCDLHIEVFAPILAIREWFRARTQSYNEFSARYAQMPNVHYLPELVRFQRQSKMNKQGSSEQMDQEWAQAAWEQLRDEQQDVYDGYEHLVDAGLAKEIARLNTPVSRYSRFRAKTDLKNWLGFLNQRMRPNAQWEIRQFANAVAEIIRAKWPRTFKLFVEHDLWAMKLSAGELMELQRWNTTPGSILDPKLAKKLQTHPKDDDAYKGVKALEGVL